MLNSRLLGGLSGVVFRVAIITSLGRCPVELEQFVLEGWRGRTAARASRDGTDTRYGSNMPLGIEHLPFSGPPAGLEVAVASRRYRSEESAASSPGVAVSMLIVSSTIGMQKSRTASNVLMNRSRVVSDQPAPLVGKLVSKPAMGAGSFPSPTFSV